MTHLARSLIQIVLAASFAKRQYWPASQTGKHSEARRLRAVARRKRGFRQ